MSLNETAIANAILRALVDEARDSGRLGDLMEQAAGRPLEYDEASTIDLELDAITGIEGD